MIEKSALIFAVAPELKTWLFGKSFPPQTFSFPAGLILRTLGPFTVMFLFCSTAGFVYMVC